MIKTLTKPLKIYSKHYKKILKLITNVNHEARLVGGCIRDSILDIKNTDIDIATTLLPQQTMQLLSLNDIKAIPTGIKFGTVSAFINNEKFEITTLRTDIDQTGRHTNVTFTSSFEQDAARRDFTINALSYCPFSNNLYDYFNGYEDLLNLKVRFIGSAQNRIQEDYLRILRFFRFSCNYADKLDEEGLKSCIALKDNLKILSKERILWEMNKMLKSENSPVILNEMHKGGILQLLLPIKDFDYHCLKKLFDFNKKFNHIEYENAYLAAKYAVLLCNSTQENINLMDLKFSRADSNHILNIIKVINEFDQKKTDFLIKKIWLEQEDFISYFQPLVAANKIDESTILGFLKNIEGIKKPKFVVSGHNLNKIGIHGPRVGKIINRLKDEWINSNFKLTKKQLINLI